MFLESMTVATKPVPLHSTLSSLLAIFINIEESKRPPSCNRKGSLRHVSCEGLKKVRAIKGKIPGRWAQGQPEARAANQNHLVYKAIPLRKAHKARLEANATRAQRQKLLTCDNDYSLLTVF